MNNLELKITTIDTGVTEVEKSCIFVSEQYENQKLDIQRAKDNIKAVQDQCKQLEGRQKELDKHTESISKIDSKLLDLESRSMRENLMFFGTEEDARGSDDNESCFEKINTLRENLAFAEGEVAKIELDRAHRMGRKHVLHLICRQLQ